MELRGIPDVPYNEVFFGRLDEIYPPKELGPFPFVVKN
jgi:hypothetical protein